MKFVCRRCDNLIRRKRYRVTTEEGGIVLLNIVVCGSCARLAKSLGFPLLNSTLWTKPLRQRATTPSWMRSDSGCTRTCNSLSGLAPLFHGGESQSTAPVLEPEPELFGAAERPRK